MGGNKDPRPLCAGTNPVAVKDGTSCLSPMSPPGPVQPKTATRRRGPKYQPERNLPAGGVEELAPCELFRVIGFDIGSASLEKPGMLEGLNAIADYLLNVDDAHPYVTITGMESRSRREGAVFNYGWNRAHAVEKFLKERTRHRPRAPIGYSTNSVGSIWSPPVSASPYVKVYWRAATIQIKLSGKSRPGVNREHGHAPEAPEAEDENLLGEAGKLAVKEYVLHKVGHKLLGHGAPMLSIAVMQIEALLELAKANQAGKMLMFRNMYEGAFEKALDELADEDPLKALFQGEPVASLSALVPL